MEKLREKVRVLGEKLKRLPAKVKDAVVKALGNLKEKLHQRFGTVGQMISKAVKRVRAMKKEVQVVLLLVIGAVIGVFLIGLKIAWMHFGFLFWPCTATCKCLISCACKGLLFCCKGGCRGLSSCCKGGLSEDPEAQNQPGAEMKKTSCCKGLSSCCKGGSSEDSEAQNQPEAEIKKKKPETEMKEKNPEAEMKKEKPEIERKKTFCCKSLSSCCKGGSSEDSEAQIQPEAETKKKKPEAEMKEKKPEAEMKKTSCCKSLSSCCKGGSTEDYEVQNRPGTEMKKTSCCYKGLVFCCKCLASCCKGGASEDSEAQIQPEAEMKKKPETEMK